MTFSRRYEQQNSELKQLRENIPIGIFGSFSDDYLPALGGARDFLRDNGFSGAKLSLDLGNEYPKEPDEHIDGYNLRMSELLIEKNDIHIFYFFRQNDDPVNTNESALMELTTHHDTKDPNTAYLLIQKGTIFAGVARGLRRKYQYQEFDEYRDTFQCILKFCQNEVHRKIRRDVI